VAPPQFGFNQGVSMKKCSQLASLLAAVGLALFPAASVLADSAEELAKETQNPVAALISLPLQLNYDDKIGPDRQGERWLLNVQPVIPFSIGEDWNLISRTIVPLVSQKDVVPGAGSDTGIGDINQSFFFSPKQPSAGGWIWGAGPVLLLPTGSDSRLTADKWGLGPTAVVLRQANGWTYGVLANHIWSVAGNDARNDLSVTFLEPFLSYTTKTFTTFGVNTESTYDWKAQEWSVPVNVVVQQLIKVGGQPIALQAGVRYWVDSPSGGGPEGWGFRLAVTFLFPK
jgi:hypothetical protein